MDKEQIKFINIEAEKGKESDLGGVIIDFLKV